MANNNNKPRKNWLSQKRDQFGTDWINRVNPTDNLNNRLRILQDICRGNFDYNGQDIVDFSNEKILNSVLEYVENKTLGLTEIVNGLTSLQYTSQASGNTALVLENCNYALTIYRNIKENLELFRLTYDKTIFITIMQNMKNFRNYIDLNRVFGM